MARDAALKVQHDLSMLEASDPDQFASLNARWGELNEGTLVLAGDGSGEDSLVAEKTDDLINFDNNDDVKKQFLIPD